MTCILCTQQTYTKTEVCEALFWFKIIYEHRYPKIDIVDLDTFSLGQFLGCKELIVLVFLEKSMNFLHLRMK